MNHPTPTLPPVVTCRAVTAIALLVAVLLAVPTSAQTRVRSTDRTTAGLVVAAVGTGLMVVAYDWRRDCDDGYRSRYEDGIVNLLRAARSSPVKSTLPIVLSRRTSPHPIQRTRGCGAGGGEPTAGGVD